MLIKISHDFDATDEAFWALFFDKDAMHRMYRDFMAFPECTVTQDDEGERIRRTIVAVPKMEMPGALAKIAGNSIRYTEAGIYDKKTKAFTWKTTTGLMTDKIKNEGVQRVETLGNGKIRRTAEITLEAKVFGLGGVIEKTFEKTIRDGWENATKFFAQELAKK
ncbi:MAG: DUF2505 family protein [Polyangiales bacterium]